MTMDGTERVRRTIMGQETDRQPVYGWVSANLTDELNAAYEWLRANTF